MAVVKLRPPITETLSILITFIKKFFCSLTIRYKDMIVATVSPLITR
jgi:hypothetical protein